MKLLILGIDGGDTEIINSMDMPFTQKLLKDRVSVPIKEDLWSRGWSEISSGLHGADTGAFYEKPKLDGTTDFTQSFTLEDYNKNPNCKLLWDELNDMGYSVGFINMPTTVPAPRVNGFFISGAGSGFSPSSRVPEIACYPKEISYELLKNNYNWEQRFWVSGIKDLDVFVEKCTEAISQRTKLFLDLSERYDVDVGFIMHREFSTLTNLFANKINVFSKDKRIGSSLQRRLAHFYRIMDDFINVAVNELSPNHVVILSDHGSANFEYSLNINEFLNQSGYLELVPNKSEKRRKLGIKHRIMNLVREKIVLKEFNPDLKGWRKRTINFEMTMAFSNYYVPGIYINDERFQGRVSNEQKGEVIERIISLFNKSEEAKLYNLVARPYKEIFQSKFAFDYLPDIWIDIPENIFPEQKGAFIQKNPFNIPFNNLQYAHRDIMTGIKGRNAICSVEKGFTSGLDLTESYDLTIAYKLILKHFSK